MSSQDQSKKRGFYDFQQPLKKTQPAKASDSSQGDMSGSKNTDHRDLQNGAHDFNYKAKVTNSGGNFHDFGNPQAGLKFNGAQKDASLDYLRERGKQGQEVKNFSGGHIESRMKTNNNGGTVYPTNPINEVFKSATSNKVPGPDPVIRPQVEKTESFPAKDTSKLGKQIRDKSK